MSGAQQAAINGQADTAEALKILDMVRGLSLRQWRDNLTTPDQVFLFDMLDKVRAAGAGLFVSVRQLARLRDIREKLAQAGVL